MWLALVGASALSLHLPAPRAAARARCATMRFEEYEALEVELRAYLAALEPQDALDAPSPLAYAELTRNGRLDLVEGCMAHGGYIAVSKRMGLPLRFANLIDAPAPQTPRITEELPPTIGLKLSGARREEEMAAAMVKAEASKSGCETRTVEKGGTIYEPTPLNLPSSTKGTAGADSQPSWQFAWLFRFDDAERASLLLFTWVSAVAYGRSSASLLDDGLLTALQIAAQVMAVFYFFGGAAGAIIAAQRGLSEPPAAWFFKVVLTGPGGLLELFRSLSVELASESDVVETGERGDKSGA